MTSSIRVLRTVQQVRQWRRQCFKNNESVGLVPTMGALHAGHCHLVRHSLLENDRTVVSIFVNPSQFAPHEDLDSYPRTLQADLEKLTQDFKDHPVDAVFVPKISEMYPSGIVLDVEKQKGTFVTVKGCSEQLEGASRPNFFRGVATVVTKLLNVINPTRVYFGQKDAQQCVVVENLVKDLLIDTKVRTLETLRESNGLAMSSRNEYLSADVREKASIIYKGLSAAESFYKGAIHKTPAVSSQDVKNVIKNVFLAMPPQWSVDYIAVSHPKTLADLDAIDPSTGALVSLAVKVPKEDGGFARLIDNVVLT